MFKLLLSAAYWWTVRIPVAVDGQYQELSIELEFRRLDTAQYDALLDEVRQKKLGDDEVVRRVVTNWRAVVDEQGQSVPFGAEALARLCRMENASANIVRHLIDSHSQVARKNS